MTVSEITKKVKSLCDCSELFAEEFPSHFNEKGLSRCPWHDDRTPSLDPKKEAVFCYGACGSNGKPKARDAFDILKTSRGLTFPQARDLLAKRYGIAPEGPAEKASATIVEEYIYEDESGQPVSKVVRLSSKEFPQYRWDADGKRWVKGLKEVQPILYHLPKLASAETIWVVEGERDVHTLERLGLVATTSPMGAGRWKLICRDGKPPEVLRGKHIIGCGDNDDDGRRHVQDVVKSLHGHAASVKAIELPDLPPKGDVTDFVRTYGDNAARDKLLALVEQTPAWTPPVQATTIPRLITFADLMGMDVPEVRWIIRDFLPEGLAVLAGAPKIGKSWLAMALSIAVACGSRALGNFHVNQGTVLHLALEDNIRRFKKRLSMMVGDDPPPESAFFASQWPPFTDSKKEDSGLDLITDWLLQHKETARLVIIDTLAKIRPRRRNRDDAYSRDYNDLEGLQSLAARFGVAVVVIHHQNKGEHRDIYNTISGSTGLTGACDTILILEKLDRTEADATLFISGRDIEDRKGALLFDRKTGLWRWTGDAADLALGRERMAIRNVLRDADGRPMSPTQIADALGKSKTAVHNLLGRMLESGEVEKAVGQPGKYRLPPVDGLYGEPWRSGQEHQVNQDLPYILDHI